MTTPAAFLRDVAASTLAPDLRLQALDYATIFDQLGVDDYEAALIFLLGIIAELHEPRIVQ
jgi:hypothetical protein